MTTAPATAPAAPLTWGEATVGTVFNYGSYGTRTVARIQGRQISAYTIVVDVLTNCGEGFTVLAYRPVPAVRY